MLILELNEYNGELLRRLSERQKLKHLHETLNWRRTQTTTDDTYDSGFLEPWVQWVSVHTGTAASSHRIQHLGDVPGLREEQLWESWSRLGRRSVVWGVMNGSRRDTEHCDVFIPDPWTFSEPAFPQKFQPLIELPRYLSKNYLDISKARVAKEATKFFAGLFRLVRLGDLADGVRVLFEGFRKFGSAHVTFIVFFEYLSAMAFLKAVEENEPDDAILFLNMFAHVQHHYWTNPNGVDCPQLEFAASVIDEIIGKVRSRTQLELQDKTFLLNGLSQKCTHDEPAWVLHRPIHPEKFIQHLGLHPVKIEPLMTNDAHLIFSGEEEASSAFELLNSIKINGSPLLFVERNSHDPKVIFYRLDFFDEVSDETTFVHGNQVSVFEDHFVSIVTRTGKHVQSGEITSNCEGLPSRIYNHELKSYFTNESLAAAG